jgi:hypothetical protein
MPKSMRDQCEQELRKTWRSERQFQRQIRFAYTAFRAFARKTDFKKMDQIGNNPMILRILAKIGAELSGDTVDCEVNIQAEKLIKKPGFMKAFRRVYRAKRRR